MHSIFLNFYKRRNLHSDQCSQVRELLSVFSQQPSEGILNFKYKYWHILFRWDTISLNTSNELSLTLRKRARQTQKFGYNNQKYYFQNVIRWNFKLLKICMSYVAVQCSEKVQGVKSLENILSKNCADCLKMLCQSRRQWKVSSSTKSVFWLSNSQILRIFQNVRTF